MNMSKQTEKSGKAKTKKHMKVSKKNRIIATIVIIVLVLLCFSYFAYVTGLPAKILPGAKIVHTVDGKEKTVDRLTIAEMNYYFASIYTKYSSYGIISSETDLDTVYNSESGQTYRDMLWEEAASSAQGDYLIEQAAKSAGFKAVAADRYAEAEVDAMRANVESVNALRGSRMTCDQYLQNVYGSGMTVQIYRKIMKRLAVVDEYKLAVQDGQFKANQADIQEAFDKAPENYQLCRFQVYFIGADYTADASEEEKQKALDAALEKAHKIADGCQNAVDFQTRVKQVCTEDYLTRMLNGEDPTTEAGLAKAQVAGYNKEFAELCFNPETPANTSMAFLDTQETGAYAVLFEDIHVDETPTCAYRVIQLDDDYLKDLSHTLEDKAPHHEKWHKKAEEYMAQATTEEQFIELAKKYSKDTSNFIDGGYTSGVTEDSFEKTDMGDGSDPVLAPEDEKLIAWLFDPARKKGDMYIIDCVSSVKLFYFCDNLPKYQSQIRDTLTAENYNAWYTGVISDTSYSTIVHHGLIDFFS